MSTSSFTVPENATTASGRRFNVQTSGKPEIGTRSGSPTGQRFESAMRRLWQPAGEREKTWLVTLMPLLLRPCEDNWLLLCGGGLQRLTPVAVDFFSTSHREGKLQLKDSCHQRGSVGRAIFPPPPVHCCPLFGAGLYEEFSLLYSSTYEWIYRERWSQHLHFTPFPLMCALLSSVLLSGWTPWVSVAPVTGPNVSLTAVILTLLYPLSDLHHSTAFTDVQQQNQLHSMLPGGLLGRRKGSERIYLSREHQNSLMVTWCDSSLCCTWRKETSHRCDLLCS